MLTRRLMMLCFFALALIAAAPAQAQHRVPFIGHWSGVTVAADLSTFPVVGVLSEGDGWVTPLGRSTMSSPHTSNVLTGETIGEQIFTAANGDRVIAHCEGFPQPQPSGQVIGGLDCAFTSGTGKYRGATGRYLFFLVATPQPGVVPPIYETEAAIIGSIALRSRR